MIKTFFKKLNIEKEHLFWILLGLYFVLFVLVLLLIFVSYPLLLHYFSNMSDKEIADGYSMTGSLGDSINGIMVPFISALAVLTTFLAFVVQYQANQNQRTDIRRERFETKFYELLRLHRDNVSEMQVGRYRGRNAFVVMHLQLKFIYDQIEFLHKNHEETLTLPKLDSRNVLSAAYRIFFFGFDLNAQREFDFFPDNYPPSFQEVVVRRLETDKGEIEGLAMNPYKIDKFSDEFEFLSLSKQRYVLSPTSFEERSSQLGHYFRHLYQTVKFVANDQSLAMTMKEKYQYIKTLRAQLSNHEQALIYFNSFFTAGENWWKESSKNAKKQLRNEKGEVLSYFLDYKVIKNLPLNLVNFGPNPIDVFSDMLKDRGRSDKEISNELEKLFDWIGG